MENMFCVFKGKLDNISELSKYYGLNKHANEARLVVEMYKVLRDRAVLYPVDQVIKDLTGAFAFILFDDTTCTLFFATVREINFYFLSYGSYHIQIKWRTCGFKG